MLKYIRVALEISTEPEMLLFIEKGIRGCVAQCSNRHAEANNRYMGEYFDLSREESYLIYFDINNLYGAAMSQYLPLDSFEWVNELIDVNNFSDDSATEYILEVDLEYPKELHETDKDLPLCPEHYVTPQSKLSKFVTTLLPKKKYIVHHRNLEKCLSLGMKLVKIHHILKFKQTPWLKPYIDLNTELRKKSNNEFEKNSYKLMNNAVFGKIMENVRKPNFRRCILFANNDMVIIEMNRNKVRFNKPIYVGFSILDLYTISITIM